jgi:tetratricopeptide (TPR) repeat protein
VPGYTRQQLKHDRFTDATKDTVSWAVEHQNKLITAGIVLVLALLVIAGGWYYFDRQNEKASLELGAAVRTYQLPVRPAGMPPQPDLPSYASIAERGRDAEKQFLEVADKYPHTKSADIARYLAGVAAMDAGENAAAERELKTAAAMRNEDISSLAKMALAALYRSTHRDADALTIYNQLAEHPTPSVSKASALFAKAEMLEKAQPAEAAKIYKQVQGEDPTGPIGRMAQQRMSVPNK